MSHRVIGIDPGTLNTGYCIVEGGEEGIVEVLDSGVVTVDKKLPAPCRIHHIIKELIEEIKAFEVTEIWTELFVPYGARQGALWNAALTGAIIYLPTTRMQEDWVSYAVHPTTWKSWRLKPYKEMLISESELRANLLEKYFLDMDIGATQHEWDALGLLLYAHYGDPDVTQVSPA